jgi:hypothetical protein
MCERSCVVGAVFVGRDSIWIIQKKKRCIPGLVPVLLARTGRAHHREESCNCIVKKGYDSL